MSEADRSAADSAPHLPQQMRSAVDWWLLLLPLAAIGCVLFLASRLLQQAPLQAAVALTLAMIASSVLLMRGVPCHYLLEQKGLLIRAGIERWHLPYEKIERVDRVWSLVGAPAWAARRLRLRYGSASIQISPLDRDAFEQALAQRLSEARSPRS